MANTLSTAEAWFHRAVAWAIAGAYLIWAPTLVKQNWNTLRAAAGSDMIFTVVGTWSMNAGLTLVANLIMAFVYGANSPSIERFRINPSVWPWQHKSDEVRQAFWAFLPKSIGLVLFNNFAVALPLGWNEYRMGHRPELDVAFFPSLFTLAWQLALCLVVEDAVFYASHRLLHHKAVYPYVHKLHHQYYQPWTLASEHAHPIEFIVGNLVPVMAGPHLLQILGKVTGDKALGMHCFTLWWWIILRIATSLDNHCGYAFPWSPVRLLPSFLGASTEAHDFHHSHNTGMYASQFAWWDRLCGTDTTFNEWLSKRGQEGKAEAKGKGKKAA